MKCKFKDIVKEKDGFLRGPFGGDLKKSIFVPYTEGCYKVYEQGVVLQQDENIGRYYISKEYFDKKMSRFEVMPNDFLVSCSGVNYGAIYELPQNIEQGVINQALLRVRLNNNIVDSKYFYYYFKSYIVKKITGGSGDSTIPNFPPMDVVKNIEIDIPDIKTQKIIGNILHKIDTKIKLNNKINQELEKLAKTLYDYWFVQFDFPDENNRPYKSSGGEMVYSNELKREIPFDWEIGNLYTIADYYNGLACQKFRPIDNEQSLPVVKIGEMHNGINVDTELVKANIPAKNIIDSGDILFSWSATLEVMLWTGNKAGLNQHIFKVVPKSFYSKEYVYQQLSSYVINFVRIAEARKTTMGHITTDHLKQSKITLPPKEIIEKYSHSIEFVYKKMIECKKENLYLIKLRDFLLPMLMNGQVTIKD